MNLAIPSSELQYGQHFICITMTASTINGYSQALLVDRPYSFPESQVPSSMASQLSTLVQFINNKNSISQNSYVFNFKSKAGNAFTKFAKSKQWNVPFYSSVVSPYYNLAMTFETWGKGSGGLTPPYCSNPKVISNLQINMGPGMSYAYTYDHSKYGISSTGQVNCFGDINRMDTQNQRGGGTVCFINGDVHAVLQPLFALGQSCSSSTVEELLMQSARGQSWSTTVRNAAWNSLQQWTNLVIQMLTKILSLLMLSSFTLLTVRGNLVSSVGIPFARKISYIGRKNQNLQKKKNKKNALDFDL